MSTTLAFPLFERAAASGVFDGASALLVAPTATGKSHIGREAIRRALKRGEDGVHAYLVPYRALADEMYDSLLELLEGTEARVRITTGDHRDPLRPEEADLVVATYESFAGLLRRASFTPGVVVADEVHLLADDHRGPVVEGLFARLLANGRLRSLCALSAVIENGAQLADWLGVQLIEGSAADRVVPLRLSASFVGDTGSGLVEVLDRCRDGEQALVFCSSRAGAEKAARTLAVELEPELDEPARVALTVLAERLAEEEGAYEDLVELLPTGVVFHHAGLRKVVRRQVEDAFRARQLRVITSTPTLAAGVNLPAGIAVVRDVFRSDVVRGIRRQVLVPSGEILNMLGRAGRPYQVEAGVGVVLVEQRFAGKEQVQELASAVERGRGAAVKSQLPDSFEGMMRFVLAIVAERGEATRADVAAAYERTLAHHQLAEEVSFERPFEQDMMEDIPAYEKVVEAGGKIFLESYGLSPDGVHATINSSGKRYQVTLGVTGVECDCPAARQFYRGRICKHQACAIHDLLFADGIEPEARARATYNCGHVFARTLDPGTRLERALDILTEWRLLERIPSGWRSTPVGEVAVAAGFDLLLVHQAVDRVSAADAAGFNEIGRWAVEDYIADERDRGRWLGALEEWLSEVDERRITLPCRYRGDFENRLEEIARVCLLYEKAAEALGRTELAAEARRASSAVRYGVRPELAPLMALGFPQLRRARSRYLYERGIRNLEDLANAEPAAIADPRRAPESYVRQWVEQAREIHRAVAVAYADREETDEEFDELVARFHLDPAALSPT